MVSRLLLITVSCLSVAPIAAWGPLLDPLHKGFGRVHSILHLLGRDSSHEESEAFPPNTQFQREVEPLETSFNIEWRQDAFQFQNMPLLLWEPSTSEEEDLLLGDAALLEEDTTSFYECTGEECELDCAIPEEFKIDDQLAAEVVSFLGIKRAEPIKLPAVGEWE